ncbi:RlpA-like double-psi beta-barrel-protein domain-containing protein-containing protein [Lentinula aff. lateritia]|uniref:RlpA-like double-psi beta-barrel-protein domain-containing protein-containing protein n=1 Tax=Lentinula aff. lateritia TaxID=2804960 RepID=A0ACC1TM76_9AGAR|nr:RlpA-like double-psi beta-barrel-protein domain-containing protein-containing protein [Lentinula aff. lateritia]
MFIKSLLFTALTFTAISEAIPLLPRTTYTGDVTYYTPGLGACGIVNTSAQLVAAIGHIAFDSYPGATANPNTNPICGKKVTASYGGHSVTVEIVDRCVGCAGEYDLDLSSTAFSELAPLSVGRLTGVTWEYVA